MNAPQPIADSQYRECLVASVDGHSITCDDGWSFFVPPESPIVPAPGMTARFYGRGIGYPVRGLSLNGVTVFYRTDADFKEHEAIERYGRDASDWLARWDRGETVWSVEMGGFGPGYEQCIQIAAAEILRVLLVNGYDAALWVEKEEWKRVRAEIDAAVFAVPSVSALGLSGAQFGAAMNLATIIYRRGPREALTDDAVKDRLIQVSKRFPGAGS